MENQTESNITVTRIELRGDRESFSNKFLSHSQNLSVQLKALDLGNQIQDKGTFDDFLKKQAVDLSNDTGFAVSRSTNILKDAFKDQFGMTPNEMRLSLKENEDKLYDREGNLSVADKAMGYEAALKIAERMKDGDRIKAFRAEADEANHLADRLNITDRAAKKVMAISFEDREPQKFNEWKQKLNDEIYEPQVAELRGKSNSKEEKKAPQFSRTQQMSL